MPGGSTSAILAWSHQLPSFQPTSFQELPQLNSDLSQVQDSQFPNNFVFSSGNMSYFYFKNLLIFIFL